MTTGLGWGTLTETEAAELEQEIGEELASRIQSARVLTNRWLGTRSDTEGSVFKHVVRVVHDSAGRLSDHDPIVMQFSLDC